MSVSGEVMKADLRLNVELRGIDGEGPQAIVTREDRPELLLVRVTT